MWNPVHWTTEQWHIWRTPDAINLLHDGNILHLGQPMKLFGFTIDGMQARIEEFYFGNIDGALLDVVRRRQGDRLNVLAAQRIDCRLAAIAVLEYREWIVCRA
jgi:hypothetical protein